jgi:RNA polymerase sigma-70 factor, ECF subfamily
MPSSPASDLIDRIVSMRPALSRQARLMVGNRPQIGLPDDIVQDTMVTALQSLDRFADDNLGAWLAAILRNHVRNASRRAHVKTSISLFAQQTDLDDGDEPIEFPVAATQDVYLEVGDALGTLKQLSAADQQIIWLARVDELSHDQIARRLGVPVGTLYARLARATARLRNAYETEPSQAA